MAVLFSGRGEKPGAEFLDVPDVVSASRTRKFEIGERIKAGGNGVVHSCTDVVTGMEYAIKFQLDHRPDRLKRFAREQHLLSELHHEHLMSYEDHGIVKGTKIVQRKPHPARRTAIEAPFVIMELARCSLLESVMGDEIGPEMYYAQFRGLSRALGALHEKAVHRDIKPENILVVGDRWVISDYGLCDPLDCPDDERLTPDWKIVGPRFWMSPEANNQSVGRADPIGAASDVFQLASVFWFVVNKCHPTGVLLRSDWLGPEALFEPVFRALHYDRKIRPQSGAVFADLIEAAILTPT